MFISISDRGTLKVNKKPKRWAIGFLILSVCALTVIGGLTVYIDPFIHYHAPKTDEFYYELNNERSQNNGIVKFFQYEGLITGSSQTENFKTSEAENLWGKQFIKVPFSGGSFKEIDENLRTAVKSNPNLKVIIRGLDPDYFTRDKDHMRKDLGSFPTYLYDDNIFNDVQYVFNRDVVFSRNYQILQEAKREEAKSGITSFDQYNNWMSNFHFGKAALYPNGIKVKKAGVPVELSEEKKTIVIGNVRQNITALADENPELEYYCFFIPYSIKWWQGKIEDGTVYEAIQTEKSSY